MYLLVVVPAAVAILAGAVIHLAVFDQTLVHLAAWAGSLALGAILAFRWSHRARIAWAVPAVLALWGPMHQASWWAYLLIPAFGAVLFLRAPSRLVGAAAAAAAAAVGGFALAGSPVGALLGAAAGGAVAAVRFERPTSEGLDRVEAIALWLPATILAGALTLNAVTGRADQTSVDDLLGWLLALFGTLAIVSWTLLGLHVLLSSNEPRQRGAWTSLSAGVGLAFGVALEKDPSLVLDALVAAGVPVFLLAAVFGERLTGRRRFPWPFAALAMAAILTLGL